MFTPEKIKVEPERETEPVEMHQVTTVNLWQPPKEEKFNFGVEVTYAKVNELIRKIAWKVGWDKFGLKQHEFEFIFKPGEPTIARTVGGPKVTVFFSVWPFAKEFDECLNRALGGIKLVKQSTAIETLAKLNEYKIKINVESKAVPNKDIEIETYRVVTIKHKKTGMVMSISGKETENYNRMIWRLRVDLKEKLDFLDIER